MQFSLTHQWLQQLANDDSGFSRPRPGCLKSTPRGGFTWLQSSPNSFAAAGSRPAASFLQLLALTRVRAPAHLPPPRSKARLALLPCDDPACFCALLCSRLHTLRLRVPLLRAASASARPAQRRLVRSDVDSLESNHPSRRMWRQTRFPLTTALRLVSTADLPRSGGSPSRSLPVRRLLSNTHTHARPRFKPPQPP